MMFYFCSQTYYVSQFLLHFLKESALYSLYEGTVRMLEKVWWFYGYSRILSTPFPLLRSIVRLLLDGSAAFVAAGWVI